jgi:dipeptidyl aminopeptidase/acylaminoacyl peptidase
VPEPTVTAEMCAYGRTVGEPRLSPDGGRLAFVANAGGLASVVTVPAGGGPELVVTAGPPPRPSPAYGGGAFDWLPDGSGVVYAAVDGGLWQVAGTGGRRRRVVEPPAGGPATAPAVSPDGSRVAYLVDAQHVAVAPLAEKGPWPVRLSAGADFCFDPAWSPDGRLVAWHEWDVPAMPWDASRIAVAPADGTGSPATLAGGDGVSTGQPRFSPDGSRLGFLSDAAGWLNVWSAAPDGSDAAPVLDEPCEHGDPAWGPGQRSWAWSPDGRSVAVCRNERGFGALDVVDAAGGGRTGGVPCRVGRGVHGGLSWVGGTLAAVRSGARTPTQVVAYDLAGGDRRLLARGPVGGFEEAGLVEPEPVTWACDDGATVHGRLYRPDRPALDPPPMILWVHGGPTSQWQVSFVPRFAFFLDRGWAILVPDHRGSTGHGRAYTQAMAGRWGELDVADCAAGMRAAAERGWADPRRMVPMGSSAGGCTVLNLLAHHPELCAAGVDLFGVADLFDLDETTHRFEAHYLHSVVGPLPAAADLYRERSPVQAADRITAPLLILQGAEDKVVRPAQSAALAERLRARGAVVEHHVYEGEGHGWQRRETVVDELERVESFLRRHVLRWRG